MKITEKIDAYLEEADWTKQALADLRGKLGSHPPGSPEYKRIKQEIKNVKAQQAAKTEKKK